ncbi:MAG: hypothetical protein U0K57_01130, partial [Lachnospiraceae bacterium]|nr:hypothetical protein [Lachnospiraceae bacterium]
MNKKIRELLNQKKDYKRWLKVVAALAVVVVLATVNILTLPGSAWTGEQAATESVKTESEVKAEEKTTEAKAKEEATTTTEAKEKATEAKEKATEAKEKATGAKEKATTATEKKEEATEAKEEATEAEKAELITEPTTLKYEKANDYTIEASFDQAAKFPKGVSLEVKEIKKGTNPEAYEKYYKKAVAKLKEENDDAKLNYSRFFDISFVKGQGSEKTEIEPEAPVKVKISYANPVRLEDQDDISIIHLPDEKKAELIGAATKTSTDKNKVKEVKFTADSFSVYAIVGTETLSTKVMTASGDTYEISVTYGPEAKIPNGSTLTAVEILEGGEEYEEYYEKTLQVLQEQSTQENYLAKLDFARFFDVTIYNGEGAKIEPEAPVEVKITY